SSYDWPGNVRELHNAMERASLMARGGIILAEHLPRRIQSREADPLANSQSDSSKLKDIEGNIIVQTLKENANNRSETARKLGISRRSLLYKLQKLKSQGIVIDP
ncbi:MAG: hypothetical protein HQL32_10215, partial [Planctomycetes bacterium]|nr:hypothetical protein [Planctomycetota bacterium]